MPGTCHSGARTPAAIPLRISPIRPGSLLFDIPRDRSIEQACAARWRTRSVAFTIHTLKQALSESLRAKPHFMTGSVSAFWLPRGNRPLPSPTACSCLLTDVPHRTLSFETLLAKEAPSASTEIVLLMRFCISSLTQRGSQNTDGCRRFIATTGSQTPSTGSNLRRR